MAFLDNDGLSHLVSTIKTKLDSKSDKTHTHNYAGSSSAGGSATSAVKLDTATAGSATQPVYFSGGKPVACTSYSSATVGTAKQANTTVGVTTAGTGAAYTATVDGITALTAGVTFTMIPHTVSTTTAPTINVNSLGAKSIRMRVSNSPNTTTALSASNFLTANKPVKLLYDGTYWIIDDMVRPNAEDLYGTVPESSLPTMIAYGTEAPTSSTAGYIYIQTI